MGDDDLADGVGVYESNVEDEGNEMLMQDYGLEEEVSSDDRGSSEEGEEAVERGDGVSGVLATGLHYVEGAVVVLVFGRMGVVFSFGKGEWDLCIVFETRTKPP